MDEEGPRGLGEEGQGVESWHFAGVFKRYGELLEENEVDAGWIGKSWDVNCGFIDEIKYAFANEID